MSSVPPPILLRAVSPRHWASVALLSLALGAGSAANALEAPAGGRVEPGVGSSPTSGDKPAGDSPVICYPGESGDYCVPMCEDVPCLPGQTCANCPPNTTCDPVAGVCRLPCGDGICQPGIEDCGVCAQDCPCPAGESCQNRQCVPGGGGGPGWCGDGDCRNAETCSTCPQDCCPGSVCGNRVVDPGETCATCLADVAATAEFTASRLFAQPGEIVTFAARPGRYMETMPILWDMGDGTHLTDTPLRYSYPSAGFFTVRLTVTDPVCRSTQSAAQHLTIFGRDSCTVPDGSCCGNGVCNGPADEMCPEDCESGPPRCDTVECDLGCAKRPAFTSSHLVVATGDTVMFTAIAHTIAGTVVNWDFGDTTHCGGCGLATTHTYDRPGAYTVMLTATDTVCGAGLYSLPVTIHVRQPDDPGPVDAARVNATSVPSCMLPGERRNVNVRMGNHGWSDWFFGYSLSILEGSHDLTRLGQILVTENVGYLGSFDFTFPITAPETPGRYYLGAQMQSPNGPFGETFQQWVEVHPSCTGGSLPGEGRYGCDASVRTENNRPVPDVLVSLSGYTLVAGGEPTLVDMKTALTDAHGRARLRWEPPTSIQQLRCGAAVSLSQAPPIASAYDPIEVPSVILDLNVTQLTPVFRTRKFRGLKHGDAVAHLVQNGPYDKPVVIPMPFDPGEQTPEAVTYWRLLTQFFYPIVPLAAEHGWDLIFTVTSSGQNIHEQAAEFAQVIDDAAQRLGPGGKVVVAGYSLGGVTARLATARYEADPDWVQALGLANAELPVELVLFGDAPLEGAHASTCLSNALWYHMDTPFTGPARAKLNLNSCGAQQLLRDVAPRGSVNHDNFYRTGYFVSFPNDPCYKVDRDEHGRCVCEGGPPVLTVNGDGWPHGPRLAAFSSGAHHPNWCYLDNRDVGPFGGRVCDQPPVGPHVGFPGPVQVGDAMYKIRVPFASDYVCYAEARDVEGGSRMSGSIRRVECGNVLGVGRICGGIEQWIGAVFIPTASALPAGAPFANTQTMSFNGTHVSFYPEHAAFVTEELNAAFDRIAQRLAPEEQERRVRAEAERLAVTPVPAGNLAESPVTIILPGVAARRKAELTTVAPAGAMAGRPAGHTAIGPPAVYRVDTNVLYRASAEDPISVCIQYGPYGLPGEERVSLFRLGEYGWQPIGTYVDVQADRACGNSPALGVFGVFAPENRPPTAVAVAEDVQVGPSGSAALVLNGAGSFDPDGDTLLYEWFDADGGPVGETAIVELSVGPGSYDFVLEVRDSRQGPPSDAKVTVTANRAPSVTVSGGGSCHPKPQVPCPLSVAAAASDPDGDTLSYVWSGCASGAGPTAVCHVTAPVPQAATVTVTDGRGGSASATLSVHGTNQAPVFVWEEFDQTAPMPVGVTGRAEFGVSDPDGDAACGCSVGHVAGACTLVDASCRNNVFTVEFLTQNPAGPVGLCYVKFVNCADVWQARAFSNGIAIEVAR